MFAPALTPILAEKSLVGATAHALEVRAQNGFSLDINDNALYRAAIEVDELAASTTAYAVSLAWWAFDDAEDRERLMHRTRDLLLGNTIKVDADAEQSQGYAVFCSNLTHAVLASCLDDVLEHIVAFIHHIPEIDVLTHHYADSTVRALLLSGTDVFGPPDLAPEWMRTHMTTIAYSLDQAS